MEVFMKSQWLYLIYYKFNRNQGQSMLEYVLVIGLIALAVIFAISNFGDALLDFYTAVKDTLLGI
jgi:Flp pilus assembly pilin Flp